MSTVPTAATCDGIVISAPGGPEVLRWSGNMPLPELGPDDLLIDVAFSGVNRHDCNQRRRGPTPAHSDVPGLEVSGVVLTAGLHVRQFKPGDAVCALVDGGGYATRAVAPAALAFKVESPLSLKLAAALPEAMFTVWHNLFRVAALKPGESVLIHGGTSGVGSFAIQLLRCFGHPVLVTCGSDEKATKALSLGATHAINYRTQDFADLVLEFTAGQGVDVILDMAGGAHSRRNIDALAHRGRLVHLSPGNGAEFAAPLRGILAKEAKVTGSLLRPLPMEEKTIIAKDLRKKVMPLIGAGLVTPCVEATFPLSLASEAHTPPGIRSGDGKNCSGRFIVARIRYADLSDPAAAPIVERIIKERGSVLHLYQMLLNSPPLAEGWLNFLTAIRQKCTLAADLRELVIMRVAILNGAQYEADQHAPIALSVGVSEAQLRELTTWEESSEFSARQRSALLLTDQMTKTVQIDPRLINDLSAFLSDREVVELVATVAAYNMVSRFLEALGIHSDDAR